MFAAYYTHSLICSIGHCGKKNLEKTSLIPPKFCIIIRFLRIDFHYSFQIFYVVAYAWTTPKELRLIKSSDIPSCEAKAKNVGRLMSLCKTFFW